MTLFPAGQHYGGAGKHDVALHVVACYMQFTWFLCKPIRKLHFTQYFFKVHVFIKLWYEEEK